MQPVPSMGLQSNAVAQVKPGTARNHLVPNGLAVYAHYLNMAQYARQINVRPLRHCPMVLAYRSSCISICVEGRTSENPPCTCGQMFSIQYIEAV